MAFKSAIDGCNCINWLWDTGLRVCSLRGSGETFESCSVGGEIETDSDALYSLLSSRSDFIPLPTPSPQPSSPSIHEASSPVCLSLADMIEEEH